MVCLFVFHVTFWQKNKIKTNKGKIICDIVLLRQIKSSVTHYSAFDLCALHK